MRCAKHSARPAALSFADQRTDRLRLVLVRHHHRVGSLDHHHILQADAGEQPVLRDEQCVARVGGMHIAVDHVAVGVLRLDIPQRVPGADVRPAGVEAHHHRVGDLLHHRVVDRIGRTLGEGCRIHPVEGAVALALAVGALANLEDVGAEFADGIEPDGGAHRVDAGVPQVLAGSHVVGRLGRVRLLDESLEVFAARADVAVAGLGRSRRHPECDHLPLLRQRRAARHRLMERVALRNEVVRGHREQHRIVGSDGVHRGQGERGSGAATFGFKQDGAGPDTGAAQLLLHQEAVGLVADDQRFALAAQRRFLQQRALAVHRVKGLRMVLARKRP